MVGMKRIYETLLKQHFRQYKQMLFLAGPRQVGKTTISLTAKRLTAQLVYLNWDNQDHKKIILKGPAAVADFIGLEKLRDRIPIVVFDELHKYRQWKSFLKGFFDTYGDKVHVIVTGSSKLDIYRVGGDSLMGRYFPYRVHPISVAECLRVAVPEKEISLPRLISSAKFNALFEFGGFPDPFLNRSKAFSRRWKKLRKEQLFRGDMRDLTRIQEVDRLEMLAELIQHQAGQLTSYSNFANKLNVSVDTIRRWVNILCAFYYCFTIRPWSKNIPRSLLKEPKIYLWDWSDIDDVGQRAENFIAAQLLKAVHFWTDQGLGDYQLYFLRDKEKREVDFLVTKDKQPWFLVEVKNSHNAPLSESLRIFQEKTKAKHAFQVVINMPYVDMDCFSCTTPMIVPAKTFLSQLV
jgi:predicted AAA+ superfamily ATPase